MSFMFLTIHYPKPAHRADVLRSMQRVADALREAPGLLQVGPWPEEGGDRIVGLSLWESRAAFERAIATFAAAGGRSPDWEERPAEEITAERGACRGDRVD